MSKLFDRPAGLISATDGHINGRRSRFVSPEHRAVIEEELARRSPTLLAGLLRATEPTPEQRETVTAYSPPQR